MDSATQAAIQQGLGIQATQPTMSPAPAPQAQPDQQAQFQNQYGEIKNEREQVQGREKEQLGALAPVQPPSMDFKPVSTAATTMGSLMMVVGALAGRSTMQPMTAALNNMTGVMKGIQEGDKQMYDMHKKQFDENYKLAMDKYNNFVEQRRQIHLDAKGDMAEINQKMTDLYREQGVDIKMQQAMEKQWHDTQTLNQNAQRNYDNLSMKMDILAAQKGWHEEAAKAKLPMLKLPDGTQRLATQDEMTNGLPEGATIVSAKGTGSQQAAVRSSIVKSGVTNSLARLDEIDKKFGDNTTTSSFFGVHGENPLTKTLYGAGKGLQGQKQQEADSDWGSFIDEAIPVFTGGLRGSDSFRQFLMQQAPQPGDKPDTVKEKKRLFRENINGTSRAFFSKFQSDPSMWPPGTKPEDVQQPSGDQPSKISSDDEYNSLPPGSEFIAPDGSHRRKP
jgi:hypothetical protein